jgi:DNA-binding transcriptional ArsR family regulator
MSAPAALTQSHIARALDEMLTERSLLAARLDKLDALIAAMRDAFHLPDRASRVNGHKNGNGNGHGTVTEEAIRKALAADPLSPGELARTLGVDRAILRPQLRALEQRGLIVTTGVTASRRVALAPVKRAPAKEVP